MLQWLDSSHIYELETIVQSLAFQYMKLKMELEFSIHNSYYVYHSFCKYTHKTWDSHTPQVRTCDHEILHCVNV